MATLYNIFTYTYLLTYLYENFGCVKNLATHHTDFTSFISFFCIHRFMIIFDSSGSGSVHEFPLSVG